MHFDNEKYFFMVRILVVLVIWTLQAALLPCNAQDQPVRMPAFKDCFDVWHRNRTVYNQYNDSVFLIKGYKNWAAFFNRRSVKVHQLYQEDKQIMDGYIRYFQSDEYQPPTQAYLALRDELYRDITAGNIDDPFILLSVCDVLEKVGAHQPDSLRSDNLINALRLYGYMQMWNMGGDKEYLKCGYQCGKFLLSEEAKKYPYYLYSLSAAMRYMTRTCWLVYKLQTIPEFRECCHRLEEYLKTPNLNKVISSSLIQQLHHILDSSDEALVRNTYLVDKSTMDKQEADSLMKSVIQRNLSNPNLSSLSYLRTLYMQMSVGQITAKRALELSLQRYERIWGKMKDINLDYFQLNEYLQPFYTFFYINYKAEIPVEEKRKNVQRMCQDIERVYMNRKDQCKNTDYVRDMFLLSTYNKVTMYLTPEEVESFLNVLNIATQPASYVHSLNTAKITQEIVLGVMKYQPELFVGFLGNTSALDVKKNKKRIMAFAYKAALYHDIGKNSIASLMNKGHRPLLGREQVLMESHPDFSVRYLSQTPTLAQFKDVALGHHKWYNGKGGYPAGFDNTKSPIRIMIDIVAIADCIQDAAEEAVRYDGYPDPMLAKMEELRKGAGVQFNPDLVALVDNHQEIKEKLSWLINEGWVKTSYDIAQKYFGRTGK